MAVNQIKLSEIYSEEYLKDKLEKAGEGSRGGKVIGHTSNGKPIYAKEGLSYRHKSEAWKHLAAHKKAKSEGKQELADKHAQLFKHHYAEAANERGDREMHQVDKKQADDILSGKIKVEKADTPTIGLSEYNPKTTIGNNPHLVKAFKQEEQIDYSKIKQELDSKLEKGMIDNDLHTKAINQLNSLVKAKGEGSRGGHVIGHTSSGKAVYAKDSMKENFTAQDHKEAADLHRKQATRHFNEAGSLGSYSARDAKNSLGRHHEEMAHGHEIHAQQKEKEQHEKSLSSDEKKILADQKKKQIEHHKGMVEHHLAVAEHLAKHGKKLGIIDSEAKEKIARESAQRHKEAAETLEKE